ncbi:MAG: ergothioneine biosynthesis protein EgtB [Parvularculaceae bacterium]|nr:ergothioneine biosynthesis protein EgtB [Parvularculaceae bacterium]
MKSVTAKRQHPPVADRTSLRNRFARVREATRKLVEPLSDEDCALQSMPDASPVKWHLAHTTWFFETFVLSDIETHEPEDTRYAYLFNSYYNAVGAQYSRSDRGKISRPSLKEIASYRENTEHALLEKFDTLSREALRLVELGINHEQQHQELILTDIKHLFSFNPLWPKYRERWPLGGVNTRDAGWRRFERGAFEVGADGASFHFDNEAPRHAALVADFELATHPVTNAQFLEFIEDGGYQRAELWLDAGWRAVNSLGWKAPLYWRMADSHWRCFTLHGDAPIDPNAPVCHISFYEAEAFARWAQARLPSEFEWEIASRRVGRAGNFLESEIYHPTAPKSRSADRELAQMFGDVWEWTRSDYAPYPGYRPAAGAVGEYNGKFMSGQYVLKGGSCATPENHIRPSYRNFFPPESRWQFSGLRLARDAGSVERFSRPKTLAAPRFHNVARPAGISAREEISRGLLEDNARISPKFFYDLVGSQLFETITRLPEYYIPRAEAAIFDTNAEKMGDAIREALGEAFQIVDLGAGNCEKAERLIPFFKPSRYVAVDISAEFLKSAITRLVERFPEIPMAGVGMDFSEELALPADLGDLPTLIFYPGSSLGNFERAKAQMLLQSARAIHDRSAILLGVDLVKDVATLEAAYDDAAGVTAAFNRNVLTHVNKLIGADFDPAKWRHVAFFNSGQSRIEMHLEAIAAQAVAWEGGRRRFEKGERILTEYSHKWRGEALEGMLADAGFSLSNIWTDDEGRFAVALGAAR